MYFKNFIILGVLSLATFCFFVDYAYLTYV